MSTEKQKRTHSVAFTPEASDHDACFSDLLEGTFSGAALSPSAGKGVEFSVKTGNGIPPKKNGKMCLANLQETFHSSNDSKSLSHLEVSRSRSLSPDDCLSQRYKNSICPSLSSCGGVDQCSFNSSSMLVYGSHSKTKNSRKHIHERRGNIGLSPVGIFVSSAGEEDDDENKEQFSSRGLRKQPCSFGSTGNLVDMSTDHARVNLTKNHLGKSLQQVRLICVHVYLWCVYVSLCMHTCVLLCVNVKL